MFAATESARAPWHLARFEDKKRARLSVISHLLAHVPCKSIKTEKVKLTRRRFGTSGRRFDPESTSEPHATTGSATMGRHLAMEAAGEPGKRALRFDVIA